MHLRRSLAALSVPCLAVCAIVFAISARAATIQVPSSGAPTIQAGIDAAQSGDIVLVAPGTYYENIDFKGKAITVTSSGGAALTTIDGQNTGGLATVLFSGGETSSSVISGFTIRGGGDTIFTGTSDGGIEVRGTSAYVAGPSPTIRNNIITANYCHNIDVEFASPTIVNNEISGVLQNPQGTGSQQSYCALPAAIYLGGTSNFQVGGTSVISNIIENNIVGGSAIHVNSATKVLVMNNVIRNNYSREPGSAFINENTSNSMVIQNLIYGNTSTCGGALAFNGAILIANNTLVDNVYVNIFSGSECTAIAQIYPENYGYGQSFPDRVILNNIISGNTSYPAVNCSWFNQPNLAYQPTFQNNILYNAGGLFFGSYCIDVSNQGNNIAADPQFVNAAAGDYHLKSASPAVDKGLNSVLQTFQSMTGKTWSTDFDGNPRVQGTNGSICVIDMGAYETLGTQGLCADTVTLTSSLNPSYFSQSVTFTATVNSPPVSNSPPTGSIAFTEGVNTLGAVPLVSSGANSATAAFPISTLAVGTHAITAVYTPAAGSSAGRASLSQVVTGLPTTVTISSSLTPALYGQPVTFTATVANTSTTPGTPTGSVAFSDGATSLGIFPLNSSGIATAATSTLAAGSHTITATYVPTSAFAASSGTFTENIIGQPSLTLLTAAPDPAFFGTAVTISATVNGLLSTPTGTITFFDGTGIVGTASLNASTQASLNTSTLAVGTHTLTAVYSGNSTYAGSTSLPFSEAILPLPQDFSITLASPSISIKAQHHTTTSLTLGSINGFADSLAISCTNVPQYVTCQLTPSPAALAANGTTSVSLYLDTDSVLGYAHFTAPASPAHRNTPISLALLLSPFSLLALSRRFRRAPLHLLISLLALLPISFALSGCGEIILPYYPPPFATPGTYTIPITATGANTHVSHTANLTLTITP